jgi:hypothetical protein
MATLAPTSLQTSPSFSYTASGLPNLHQQVSFIHATRCASVSSMQENEYRYPHNRLHCYNAVDDDLEQITNNKCLKHLVQGNFRNSMLEATKVAEERRQNSKGWSRDFAMA